MSSNAQQLKEQGNAFFKSGDYTSAESLYSQSIALYSSSSSSVSVSDKETLKTLLCNRAACWLKLNQYQSCRDDCTAALEIDPSHCKALYRRACAYERLGDLSDAFKDLSKLMHIDNKNHDAIAAMRRVKAGLDKERARDSEVQRILTAFKSGEKVSEAIRALVGLCVDDSSHSMEFYRKGGVLQIGRYIESRIEAHDYESAALGLRLFGAASTHARFVRAAINLGDNSDNAAAGVATEDFSKVSLVEEDGGGRVLWSGVGALISHPDSGVSQTATSLALRCLKALPSGVEKEPSEKPSPAEEARDDDNVPRVEELDDDESASKPEEKETKPKVAPSAPIKEYDLFLRRGPAVTVLRGWLRALSGESDEAFMAAADGLASFLSEIEEYIGHEKIIDTRMEGLQERKDRIAKVRLLKNRSKTHALWAVEEGALDCLLQQMDSDNASRRQRSSALFGRLASALDDEESLKKRLTPHLVGHDAPPMQPGDPLPPVSRCRLRAVLEASLFVALPEIGAWALKQNGGIQQLLLLISSGDDRCQEIAAEVSCLASTSESGSALMSPVVSSGALQTLMQSPNPGTRAAAASALTKLSLQAKALKEDSSETSQMLNVVLDVLKSSAAGKSSSGDKKEESKKSTGLVSFSACGDSFSHGGSVTAKSAGDNRALTSTERAVEVLAAMVGKSFVKEELVHGSYRVAASLEALLRLDLNPDTTGRSTVPYGVAYIIAAITVTNNELREKALAEKDISMEQYKQLQELQRVKAKDEDGNEIEEKKEEDDPDTDVLCRQRIKRIVALNGIPAIITLMTHESKQTKECACRALRQICVEESIRGQVVQQGGLKSCILVSVDEDCEKSTRREAAHAIAKTLVTTNPNILSEHLRLGSIRPLIFLSRDVDSTNLQQFEALLALTNLTSCGDAEQDKFVSDKGINAAHYLMFSDHLMVRRAATETLCNLGAHESLLKIMRDPEKVRLWLGFCEDWANEDNSDAFATARAAAGTLAYATSDLKVAQALLKEDCATTIRTLLESGNPELVHRTLVIVSNLCECEDSNALATHLIEGGIVPSLATIMKDVDGEYGQLAEMARDTAVSLSSAVSTKSDT